MLKILLVDDHEIVRHGLAQMLLNEYPDALIEQANNVESAIEKTTTTEFDIIISDLTMPGRSGLELLHYLKKYFPKTPVLILSMGPEESYAIGVLKAGASGYLSKETATREIIEAVRRILLGHRYISVKIAEKIANEMNKNPGDCLLHELLSNRELEVFKLLAKGKTLSDISAQFAITVSTVSTYRGRIMIKMAMRTNVDLSRYALSNKLI